MSIDRNRNDSILNDTLSIISKGHYNISDRIVVLKEPRERLISVLALSPEEVYDIIDAVARREPSPSRQRCYVHVEEKDSFEMASDMMKSAPKEQKKICVLNFANPITPGGGVRRGARAQEETLCLRSSLLYSLESQEAVDYYHYNRSCSFRGSDAMILSPYVSVFKDCNYNYLQEDFTVAVLTVAAPMVSPISHRLEDVTEKKMENILRLRILSILSVAIYFGYDRLVLGAWGCGAFGNDARVISRLFKEVLQDVNADTHFKEVCFAILAHRDPYNLECFRECFT